MEQEPVGMLLFEVWAQDKNGNWIDVGRFTNDDVSNDLTYIGCPKAAQAEGVFDDGFSILNRQLVLTPVMKIDSNGKERKMPLDEIIIRSE